MNAKNCLILCLLVLNGLKAQTFEAKLVQNYSDNILSQKFKKFEVINLQIDAIQSSLNSRSNSHSISINTPTVHWDLTLTEFNLLKKDYYLRTGGQKGLVNKPNEGRIKTYKVIPNSPRAGLSNLTIADHFIYGFIEIAGNRTFIEPLISFDPKALPDEFVIYNEVDVIPTNNITCGSDDLHNKGRIGDELVTQPNALRAGCLSVDVALSCDLTVFNKRGGIAGAEAFMIGVLNNVQTNYDNEFNSAIEFGVAATYVPTNAGEDPWNSINNINSHLNTHTSWGNGGGYGGASYAVATTWTTKYTSGAIGLAWVGAMCGGYRYNVCSDFGGSAGLLRCLQSHELGHNFDADHDASGSGFIMAPAVSNSNTWSPASLNSINSYLPFVGCAGGCSSGTPPTADFTASPNPGCANTSIKFTDLSQGTPTTWAWTFPGGTPSSSTQQHPVIVYKNGGTYDVTLKVTNSFGNNTLTLSQFIEISPAVTNSFTANIINNNELLTSNTSQDADSYLWKFGDGVTSTEDEPSYIYKKDGTYKVELCATNLCGTICKSVNVQVVTPPVANFTSDIQEGCADLKVKFKNSSSSNSTVYKWEFPGGTPSTSSDKEPTITYSTPGVYEVKLTASNSKFNNVKIISRFIKVDKKPKSDFNYNSQVGYSIQFDNKTIDTVRPAKYSYRWNFGDGKTSTERNPNYTFSGPGKYNVCLITDNGCGKDTLCKEVELVRTLIAAFTSDNNKACLPMTVNFKNKSVGATSYRWIFPGGNPSTSAETDPKVKYSKQGKFDVTLIAYSNNDSTILKQISFVESLSPVLCPQHGGKNNKAVAKADDEWNDLNYRSSTGSNQQLTITPNPNSGIFTLNLPVEFQQASTLISISDLTGVNMELTNSGKILGPQIEFNLSDRNPGVYFINVQNNNSRITKRFVIIK